MPEKVELVPMPSRIIVKEDEFKYEGRVVIPENVKRRPTVGVVEAVGANITNVAVGDRVVYAQFSGTLIQFRGLPAYRVLVEEEVLLKVSGDLYLEGTAA